MNKKIKLFYLVDILIIIIFLIGMFINNFDSGYGLAALSSVGYFVVFGILFIVSISLLFIVTMIRLITKISKKSIRK